MESSGVFNHRKTIPCWIDPNLSALGTIKQSYKFFSTKLTSKNEHKVEVLQVDKRNYFCCFTQRRTYGVQGRSLTRTNHFWKTAQSIVSRMKKIQGNHITMICVFFVLLVSRCTEINNWRKKFQIHSIHSSKNGWIEHRSFPRSPRER